MKNVLNSIFKGKQDKGAMWIFACYDNNRLAAMSMFANTAKYTSEEHAVSTVRSRFSLNAKQNVKFVKPELWNAPNIVITDNSFKLDMQTINGLILKYLETQNYERDKILKAIDNGSAIPNPSMGILLFCINLL